MFPVGYTAYFDFRGPSCQALGKVPALLDSPATLSGGFSGPSWLPYCPFLVTCLFRDFMMTGLRFFWTVLGFELKASC
jgi:hypothetical protein